MKLIYVITFSLLLPVTSMAASLKGKCAVQAGQAAKDSMTEYWVTIDSSTAMAGGSTYIVKGRYTDPNSNITSQFTTYVGIDSETCRNGRVLEN